MHVVGCSKEVLSADWWRGGKDFHLDHHHHLHDDDHHKGMQPTEQLFSHCGFAGVVVCGGVSVYVSVSEWCGGGNELHSDC